jgi:L-threonylcarbamoyladenylate synthase
LNSNSRLRTVDAHQPQPDIIREAARVIGNGGVVVIPTRGLYGLAVDALNAEAVERLYQIKGRSHHKPILVLISRPAQLADLTPYIPPAAEHLMRVFWPGRLTLVLQAIPTLLPNLTAGTGKIGVRLVGHPVAAALVRAVGRPITGTSANVSGRPACSRIDHLDSAIAAQADLILDAGPLEGGRGSTVVDVTGRVAEILREGQVPASEIERVLSDRE